MSHKFSAFQQQQSSTYRECLVVSDLYTMSQSPVVKFKRQQVMHVTDNQGVVAVFTIDSPRAPLNYMAVKVYMAANRLNIKLHFVWRSRDDPIMQIVDKSSRGPWLNFYDFSLDADAIQEVKC